MHKQGFKYQKLAVHIEHQITSGQLKNGDRLCSIRDFSKRHTISLNTAKACYQLLEAKGLISVKPKSGYFVQYQPHQTADKNANFLSYPRQVSNLELLVEIQQAAISADQVHLGTIQIDPKWIPLDNLRRSLNRAIKHCKPEDFLHCDRQGHIQLRTALVELWREDSIYIPTEQVFISSGCMPALALLIQVLSHEKDSIIVTSPTFNGQLQLIANLKRKIIEIPASSQGIDLERLEQVMQSGQAKLCLLTANFQNPLGYCLSHQEKQHIAKLAEKYQCFILEDDVFAECGYQVQRPLPIKYWDQAGYVIWCSSISKSLSHAYRIGWFCLGEQAMAFSAKILTQNQMVNTPLQLGLADFIYSKAYREHLSHLHHILQTQVRAYIAYIQATFAELLLECHMPEGGYILWLKLRPEINSVELYHQAKAHQISIVPGLVFSEDGKHQHYIRLNAGHILDEKMKQAITTLAQCSRMLYLQHTF